MPDIDWSREPAKPKREMSAPARRALRNFKPAQKKPYDPVAASGAAEDFAAKKRPA